MHLEQCKTLKVISNPGLVALPDAVKQGRAFQRLEGEFLLPSRILVHIPEPIIFLFKWKNP